MAGPPPSGGKLNHCRGLFLLLLYYVQKRKLFINFSHKRQAAYRTRELVKRQQLDAAAQQFARQVFPIILAFPPSRRPIRMEDGMFSSKRIRVHIPQARGL